MQRNDFPLAFLVIFLLTTSLTGCGAQSTNLEVAPTVGRVEFKGAPVADVYVQLVPLKTAGSNDKPGKAAGGATDSNGKFILSTYENGDGAIPGTHRVTVAVQNPDTKLPGRLPQDYTVEIMPETNELLISLDGK